MSERTKTLPPYEGGSWREVAPALRYCHMVATVKSIIGVPVRTFAGMRLGKVHMLSFDLDTGKLALVHVGGRGVVHLLENELLVCWSDIISMSVEEVVVRDGVVPIQSSVLASEPSHPTTS